MRTISIEERKSVSPDFTPNNCPDISEKTTMEKKKVGLANKKNKLEFIQEKERKRKERKKEKYISKIETSVSSSPCWITRIRPTGEEIITSDL